VHRSHRNGRRRASHPFQKLHNQKRRVTTGLSRLHQCCRACSGNTLLESTSPQHCSSHHRNHQTCSRSDLSAPHTQLSSHCYTPSSITSYLFNHVSVCSKPLIRSSTQHLPSTIGRSTVSAFTLHQIQWQHVETQEQLGQCDSKLRYRSSVIHRHSIWFPFSFARWRRDIFFKLYYRLWLRTKWCWSLPRLV